MTSSSVAQHGLPPLGRRHLAAIGAMPREVLPVSRAQGPALEELAATQLGMRVAEPDQPAGEGERAPGPGVERPVEPRDLVVLAVGVVVSLLRPADLVPAAEHRDPLGSRVNISGATPAAHAPELSEPRQGHQLAPRLLAGDAALGGELPARHRPPRSRESEPDLPPNRGAQPLIASLSRSNRRRP